MPGANSPGNTFQFRTILQCAVCELIICHASKSRLEEQKVFTLKFSLQMNIQIPSLLFSFGALTLSKLPNCNLYQN